jgi:hypothetical protein
MGISFEDLLIGSIEQSPWDASGSKKEGLQEDVENQSIICRPTITKYY